MKTFTIYPSQKHKNAFYWGISYQNGNIQTVTHENPTGKQTKESRVIIISNTNTLKAALNLLRRIGEIKPDQMEIIFDTFLNIQTPK